MTERNAADKTILINGAPVPDALNEEMIRNVVHSFYRAIREDELLGPIFEREIEPEAWPIHLAKMCDFWSSTLLRTSRYEGRPLSPHLGIPELQEEHFRRWLSLFHATVRSTCPPEIASLFIGRARRIAHSFRLAIAYHRGESTLDVEPILEDNPA